MEEIAQLLPSFRAAIHTEVNKHRQVNGAGTLDSFARDVNDHRDRYFDKLDKLRARTNLVDVCDVAMRQINQLADGEISRVRLNGKVDFPDEFDSARTYLANRLKVQS